MSSLHLRNAIEYLISDGFLYSTEDSWPFLHFKATTLSPFQITAATTAAAAAAADAAPPPRAVSCSDQVFEIFDKFIGNINDSYEVRLCRLTLSKPS